jgi:diadenosine tetraphosphatase ApaH/serine/threonine PP2A family protein phosphatase
MLAVLYDIHGNLPALEAVLDDAQAAGATRYRLGGDYSAFGGWPADTVACLRALPDAAWIRGNWERWQAEPAAVPPAVAGAARFAVIALGPELVAELAALPQAEADGDTLFCHASPGSDMDAFGPALDPEGDDQLLAGVTEARVVFGHTHVQFRRPSPQGIELVNPGSVGLPADGDVRAAYALIAGDGVPELRRVTYDVEAAADALEAIGEDWAALSARRLRAASFDV